MTVPPDPFDIGADGRDRRGDRDALVEWLLLLAEWGREELAKEAAEHEAER